MTPTTLTPHAPEIHPDLLEPLAGVMDPEIPVVSILDMGMVESALIDGQGRAQVRILPTFSGCPALDHIRQSVIDVLAVAGYPGANVTFNLLGAYTTDRITEQGRARLLGWGIAPPGSGPAAGADIYDLDFLEHIPCPRCSSEQTIMRSPFGPALCRTLHYCTSCGEGFESFKPIG